MSTVPPPARSPRSARTYAQRIPRYAANAEREALFADQAAQRWHRSAGYTDVAADNAEENDDPTAAALYDEMADCVRDAAEALEDMAKAARKLAVHYKALRQAKDALATVISDPAVFGDVRDQALSAYDCVADALNKEIRN